MRYIALLLIGAMVSSSTFPVAAEDEDALSYALAPPTTGSGEDDEGTPLGLPVRGDCGGETVIHASMEADTCLGGAPSTTHDQDCRDTATSSEYNLCGGSVVTFGFTGIDAMWLIKCKTTCSEDRLTSGSVHNYVGHTTQGGNFHSENTWWKDYRDSVFMVGCEEFVQKKWHATQMTVSLSRDESTTPQGVPCYTGDASGRYGGAIDYS